MLESLCGFGFRIGTSLVYSFPQQAGRQDGVFSPNLELSSGSGTAHLLNPRPTTKGFERLLVCNVDEDSLLIGRCNVLEV